MRYILFILLISLNFCCAQKNFTNSYDDIYLKDGLFYKVKDKQLFTGTIEFIKKNGTILRKETYNNGYFTNGYLYFNKSARGKVYEETIFYEEKINKATDRSKIKKIIRYHSNGEIYWIKYFDLSGDKILEEDFENGKLIYSCEFKNGKKNGKEFCTTRDCGNQTIVYANGKPVE